MAAPVKSHPVEGPASAVQNLTIGKALNQGLRAAMEADDKVIVMGEDVGKLGGVFRITDGLQKDFGEQRVLDTPLAESGIIGTAVGLAVRGFRPVCEIQFEGFIFPGFDQISSQLAKLHYRTQGKVKVPVVIRVPYGGGIGAVEHHSESPESLFAHIAGLKVVSCSNPVDAYWMIQQAIASDDPILFFEPKRLYHSGALKAPVDPSATPDPLFASRVVRQGGTDAAATVVAYGPSVKVCLDAAAAAAEEGRSLEVIDLRALSPLDLGPVFESVRRTGRLITVSEAQSESSITSEIAARVQQECFYSLEAPVLRVAGFDTPYPPAKLEEHFLPDLDRVLHAVDRALDW
ncbi:alpha-ketoacid dehydrogenase subunit beta [Prauserella muralis]|uniref:2-oxoisovalerate dehydrogenase n=1 Tax=Prauserella muralis TaxID=588067 RepID=A0A2V4BAM8_9PSEU|nr:alpha-ketoacid dehydrogenase subunit beta [Prauserella muralis]PXY31572.1 2-oxoisovalerate dehydrogenase [Prauserella muralis]TWE14071.1 pyruvate dehydrogenase E1 component beta subunit [Prauserella muralis]